MEIRFEMVFRHVVAQILSPILFRCASARLRRRVSLSNFCLSMRVPNGEINGKNETLLPAIRRRQRYSHLETLHLETTSTRIPLLYP